MTPAEARKELGVSQAGMARLLGVHRQTWVKWERGEQSPPAVAVTAIRMLVFLHGRGLIHAWRKTGAESDDAD